MAGDSAMMRLCIDRIIPSLKSKDIAVQLNNIDGTRSEQSDKIFSLITTGKITPEEGSSLLKSLVSQASIYEKDKLEDRVTQLEGER
jgi:hypothetical protein